MSMDKLFDGSDAHLLPDWAECEAIRDNKAVDDAIRNFVIDTTGDNATAAVQAIIFAYRAEQAEASADRDEAYDLIDRQLRNTLDDADYADYSAALDSLYLHPSPAPEGMVMVPERIEKVESGFRGMFLKEAQAYKRGWNDCRAAMIAAAEKESGK